MKKISLYAMFAIVLTATLFSFGCVPKKVKKEAEDIKEQYEDDFYKKVSEELGEDYELFDINLKIDQFGGYGLHPLTEYEVGNWLDGKVKHNGEVYDVEYVYGSNILRTNAYYPEIIDDFATKLGLDATQITYREMHESEGDSFCTDTKYHTADEFFKDHKGFIWIVNIVTKEDISDIEFFDYTPICEENKSYPIIVDIYSTDNMTNLDHFKEYEGNIRIWSDGTATVREESEETQDIFELYNFNEAVSIRYERGETMSVYRAKKKE